ncbi:DUF5677 domain-containing protein [Mucilaginibacter sp. KACC 22773]|uniref:DUF5677 domain-containing protein n=1 Tax=Mucilaginibacter sp. KACC 22773 TaxID=3025671 RepID=UPI002365497A|nr:DUF5677 domain-containing protein [Mucilaginibacter sp. KACC 22773]WDF75623.1 DUF5677 domain-containing protein [Mucilaginibacter sp. KACC 22773]
MSKFKNLLIPEYDYIINDVLEMARKKLKLEHQDFLEILQNSEVFDLVEETLTDFIINKRDVSSFIKTWIKDSQRNQKSIVSLHKSTFNYYCLFLNCCFLAFKNIRKELDGTTIELPDLILLNIYGTLCRLSDEIGILLTYGSTRSALILWRTFYEHAVVGLFLIKEDNTELYKRFMDFSHKDIKKKKESFEKHRDELKFPPLSDDKIKEIDERTESLREGYGSDFFKDYAWANGFVEGRATFYTVEEKAGMSRNRPFYIWVSEFSHPSFSGMTSVHESGDKIDLENLIKPVVDIESFIDPMQLTLSIFYTFNNHFLHRYSINHQYDVNMLLLSKLYEALRKSFDL